MAWSYWFVNSNRSRAKRFIENTKNKGQFFNKFLLILGSLLHSKGKEPSSIITKKELKKDVNIEEWKKLIAQGWIRTE